MAYDLTKDDDLHHACDLVKLDPALLKEVKDFIEEVFRVLKNYNSFSNKNFQERLWNNNPICEAPPYAPGVNIDQIIQDEDFLIWFYDHCNEIWNLEPQNRTESLCKFTDELLNKMGGYSTNSNGNKPIFCIYRALATLFPENFTRLASRDYLCGLAKKMNIRVNKFNTSQVVEGHRRILDKFAKVLGDPGDLDEVIQRMILPWDLPDAILQGEQRENLEPPSDEEQRPDDSMTSVEVHVPQLKDILPQVNDKGYFPDQLCQKLHLGLWADERRHFAVLTGLSGVGKTLLARAYAEAITEEDPTEQDPKRSCIIAVQPGWTDPSYLLGYVNPLQKDTFERTSFLKLILHAIDNPHTPHVAILDEMNLSHPEQYMAPLLSAMETGGSIEIHGHGENFDDIPNRIPYPNNLVLIGTVNMDETTHGLVDKLLDRAFTLEFWKVDVDRWPWRDSGLLADEANRVKAILKELMDALEPARLHFGYRIIKEIIAFLTRYQKDSPDWQFENALDSVIYAKVLPKLRGDYSTRISDALKDCKKVLETHGLSNSKNKVEELIKDLEDTGSARFWR